MQTILIADDEESLRTLIDTTLEAPGLRILQAANGEQAMEIARREHPDLILLDWMMPGKTGIEVAEALRQDPVTAEIAIVMLTGRDQERDRLRGLAVGIRAYLIKPFSPLQLLECVRDVLASREGSTDDGAGTTNEKMRRA